MNEETFVWRGRRRPWGRRGTRFRRETRTLWISGRAHAWIMGRARARGTTASTVVDQLFRDLLRGNGA